MFATQVIAAAGSDPMPWAAIAVLVPTLVGAGLLVIWLGRKATAGTLKRNRISGIRTKATLASDQAWEAAHKAGGPLLIWSGISLVVPGLALLVRPSNNVGAAITMVATVAVLVLSLASCVVGNRAAKAVGEDPTST